MEGEGRGGTGSIMRMVMLLFKFGDPSRGGGAGCRMKARPFPSVGCLPKGWGCISDCCGVSCGLGSGLRFVFLAGADHRILMLQSWVGDGLAGCCLA